ncbi:MAG: hypothetical protein V4473_01795 [Patescibacteria group bacterium]
MKAILTIVIVTIGIGMYILYISPTIGDIRSLQQQKDEYTRTLATSKELKIRRDTLMDAYNSIAPADLDRLNKIIPVTFDQVRFAKDMYAISQLDSISIKNIKISTAPIDSAGNIGTAATNPVSYKTISVSYTASGTYDQFIRYLRDVEQDLQLMDVTSIVVKPSDKSNVYDYAMTLTTYSLR